MTGTDTRDHGGRSSEPADVDERDIPVQAGRPLQFATGVGALVALAGIPVLVGPAVVQRVTELYGLSESGHYFQLAHAPLLYLATPIVVVLSFLLFLMPGALLVMVHRPAPGVAELSVYAFGASLLSWIGLSTGMKLVLGTPVARSAFLGAWFGLTVIAGILFVRSMRRNPRARAFKDRADRRRVISSLIALHVAVASLVPKIFWEDFNLDGIEAFEFGRSLATHLIPRWELQSGIFGLYHNFILFAYPNHWFITLLGPLEAAVRLPFFLYLIVIFALVLLLVERGRRALRGREEAVLWLALAVFTIVQVFSTNYEPFYADIAESAATDSLAVLCFLSTCFALWTRRPVWFLTFAVMTYLATPGALLLLGPFAAFTVLSRPTGWRGQFALIGAALACCLVISLGYESIYEQVVLDGAATQFGTPNLLRRLFPPHLTEFVRVNALLFPSGILPALSLFFVRRDDAEAMILGGVTLTYFAVIYIQVWTSLHQFTPIMVLPLVVFWRIYLARSDTVQRRLLPLLAVATVASLWLSLPQHFRVSVAVRHLGLRTAYLVGDYESDYERAAAAGNALYWLFPEEYRMAYPDQPWGTDPYPWIYYSARPKPPGAQLNYVVQPADEPPPVGFTEIHRSGDVRTFVRDLTAWERDRSPDFPRVGGSRLYEPILRSTYATFREVARSRQHESRP